MKFVFASDSFKGTLSSRKISEMLTIAAHEVFPDCETEGITLGDGGSGTVNAIIEALGGELRTVKVHNPLMEEINASYGIFAIPGQADRTGAIIEMSAASGVTLIPGDMLNPMFTTTYGTGELIMDAVNFGCSHITIAIGESATNDAGIGAMRALGVKFLDADGRELGQKEDGKDYSGGTGADLIEISSIDYSGICPALKDISFTVLCDVDSMLTGPDGATFTFGKQKCSPEIDPDDLNDILSTLEAGMSNYSALLARTFNINLNSVPGSGAAGGLGASLHAFLGAELCSGIETVLKMIDFDSHLENADICVTGEGCLDWQSSHGKTISCIARHCEKYHVKLDAIVGCTAEGYEDAYDLGVRFILKTCGDQPIEKSMMNAEEYYMRTARAYFTALKEKL